MWLVLIFSCFLLLLFLLYLLSDGNLTKVYYDLQHPSNFLVLQEPKARYSANMINFWIPKTWRSDGSRIPALWEGYPNSQQVILYSHGNNEDLLACQSFIRSLSQTLEMNVVAYDYSGYGLNNYDTFERTASGLNLTLETVYKAILQRGFQPSAIYLWGYSLGSGPSLFLTRTLNAQENQAPAGLILLGAYTSIHQVIDDHSPFPWSAKVIEARWNNVQNISHCTHTPILILHGQNDGLITVKHARALQRANPSQVRLIILPNTGHTSFAWPDSIQEVKKWIRLGNQS